MQEGSLDRLKGKSAVIARANYEAYVEYASNFDVNFGFLMQSFARYRRFIRVNLLIIITYKH